MDRTLYNFALLKSLYDQGHDYIDCFWPFVLRLLRGAEYANSAVLQSRLESIYGMIVPIHVIDSAVKRARARNLIKQERGGRRFTLTSKGSQYREKIEAEKDVERRLNSLASNIVTFFSSKDVSITSDEALSLVAGFVQRNRGPVLEFLNPNTGNNWSRLVRGTEHSATLVAFMQEIDHSEPQQYQTLRDLLLGSLISTVVYARDAVELENLGKKKFRNCRIYLDTNLVFSILGLHEPEWNKPAIELLKLLRSFQFEIYVLPSTVSEICNVMNGYRAVAKRYPRDLRIDTIYSGLKRKGWKGSDAKQFITEIEAFLEKRSITVDWAKEIDLKNHRLKNDNLRDTLRKYKPEQSDIGQIHDLSAIEIVADIREHRRRALEECKAIFLTADSRLSRFNFNEMQHRQDGTVCEVILDRLLTNILWLKSPKLDIPVSAIISVHSRDLFINRRVWDRFYFVLQDLHKEKKVSDDNISTLFYHSYIEDVLRAIDDSDAEKITPSFVLSHVRRRERLIDESIADGIEKREAEFLEQLDVDVSQAKDAVNSDWLNRVESVKEKIREGARKSARRMSSAARVLCFLIALGVIAYMIYNRMWETLDKIGTIVGLAMVALMFVVGSFRNVWERLLEWFSTRVYQSRLARSELSILNEASDQLEE